MSDDQTPPTPKVPRFSVKLRKELVEVEDLAGAVHSVYVTELTGRDRDDYLDWVARQMATYDATGKMTEPRKFGQHQAQLIARCLRSAEDKRYPFSVDNIQLWAASVQEGLFEMCQRICSFDKNAMESAKKGSPGSDGSGST